ncbi:hypothetical protein BGX28_008555 [Mortierella sp. GBA30]|nr:hypothetical protein BGX28_008555 [Mortierella sp. GBA30]
METPGTPHVLTEIQVKAALHDLEQQIEGVFAKASLSTGVPDSLLKSFVIAAVLSAWAAVPVEVAVDGPAALNNGPDLSVVNQKDAAVDDMVGPAAVLFAFAAAVAAAVDDAAVFARAALAEHSSVTPSALAHVAAAEAVAARSDVSSAYQDEQCKEVVKSNEEELASQLQESFADLRTSVNESNGMIVAM